MLLLLLLVLRLLLFVLRLSVSAAFNDIYTGLLLGAGIAVAAFC